MNVNVMYYVGGAVATASVAYFLNRMVEWCQESETSRRTNLMFNSDEERETCYRMAFLYPSDNYSSFEKTLGFDYQDNIRRAKEDMDKIANTSQEFNDYLSKLGMEH